MAKMIVQLVLVLVFGTLSIFLKELSFQYELCFLAILIFGIPHGALDYKIQFQLTSGKFFNLKKFVVKYILFMLGYLVMWVLFPFNALLVFIALSIYHFGQERFEELGLNSASKVGYLFWGCFVLLVPFMAQYDQLQTYIYIITSVQLPSTDDSIRNLLIVAIIVANVGFLVSAFWNSLLSKKELVKALFLVAILAPIFILSPLIVSFTVYFILVHSFNAMNHQFQWFRYHSPQYSLFSYLKDLTPFTLISYLGVLIIFMIVGIDNWQSLTLYLLVFASLLTLPHMLIFEDFYADRKTS